MKYILDRDSRKIIPTQIMAPLTLKALAHPIRNRLLGILSKKPNYPMSIAKEMGMNEQTIYYHIRQLEMAGIVEKTRGDRLGVPEFYSVKKTAFSFIPDYVGAETNEINFHDYVTVPRILDGFVENDKINCKIVVGAPIPHGELNKSMKSGYQAGEVAAILGRYGTSEERLCFTDMEIENKKDNFIIIGGYQVNTLENAVNDALPVKFNSTGTKIISTISNEEYSEPEIGFICRAKNPFDDKKSVLVMAGIESLGTKAVIHSLIKNFSRIEKGNMYDKRLVAKVVEGIEQDGKIIDVRFLE